MLAHSFAPMAQTGGLSSGASGRVDRAWHPPRPEPHSGYGNVFILGGLVLTADCYSCWWGSECVYLGRACFAVLDCLAQHYPGMASRNALAQATKQGTAGPGEQSRAMDVAVSRLRKKLQQAGVNTVRVQAISGRGYQLRLAPVQSTDVGHRGLQSAP